MIDFTLKRGIDPARLPLLGLLGAFACGPVQGGAGPGSDSDTDSTGTSDPTGASDPTDATDPTDPTSPTTTMPPTPECEVDSDCEEAYCGYCSLEGRCEEDIGCCGVHGAERTEDGKWRCLPPYYGCDYGEACPDGYVCEFNECVMGPAQAIPLPSCRPPDLETKVWNLGEAPGALVLADVDGDLDLDIVASQPGLGVLEIGLNDGAANFSAGGTIAVGAAPRLSLAAGDIDGDGDTDLVVARGEAPGVLRLLFNDGAMFTVGDELPVGDLPAAVHLADVDGDAVLDVFTVEEGAATVHFGDGMGGLGSTSTIVDPISARASVADLDGDGMADLLLPLSNGPEIKTRLGHPDMFEHSRTFMAAGAAGAPLAADLDLQGATDVVVVQPVGDGDVIEVWLAGEPLVWADLPTRFTTHTQLHGGLLAELDGNPGLDLVGVTGVDHVALVPGDGKGGFLCDHLQPTVGDSAASLLAVGDLDGDGRHDIVAGGASMTAVSLILLK